VEVELRGADVIVHMVTSLQLQSFSPGICHCASVSFSLCSYCPARISRLTKRPS